MTAPTTSLDDALAHYGVKGMKWGVRKDPGHEGERVKTKKLAKLDKKWEKKAQSVGTFIAIHNKAAELTNKNDIDRINNKPEYKDVDFSRDSPLRQKYYKEHQDAYLDNVTRAAASVGVNPSGTRSLAIQEYDDGSWAVRSVNIKAANSASEVEHAAKDEDVLYVVHPKYVKGRIVGLEMNEDELKQSGMAAADDILEHYGVKGMRWGVRKAETERQKSFREASQTKVVKKVSPKGAEDITVKAKSGKFAKASGGARNMPSDEAIRTAASRQKAKRSTPDALSNVELRQAIERMQMEQQFNKLVKQTDRRSLGEKFVAKLFGAADTGDIAVKDIAGSFVKGAEKGRSKAGG